MTLCTWSPSPSYFVWAVLKEARKRLSGKRFLPRSIKLSTISTVLISTRVRLIYSLLFNLGTLSPFVSFCMSCLITFQDYFKSNAKIFLFPNIHSITVELGTLPVSCFAFPQDTLGLWIAWVYNQDKGETDEGCDERGDEKVGDGSKGNHSVHLGIQAGSSYKKRIEWA